MVLHSTLFSAFALSLLFGSPWLVLSVWLWRRAPRDGAVQPSMAELARTRLWS
jgi:Na+(H+)/acetate symporter ActP